MDAKLVAAARAAFPAGGDSIVLGAPGGKRSLAPRRIPSRSCAYRSAC